MTDAIEIPEIGKKHPRDEVRQQMESFDERAVRFAFLRDSVEGSGGYADYLGGYLSASGERRAALPDITYLKKHPREDSRRWERRRETAYFPTYIAWVLGVAVGLLTRETPQQEGYPNEVTKWQDRRKWEQLRGLFYWWALGYGELFVLTDRPKRTDEAASAAAAKDSGAYTKVIHPDSVWDIEEDDEGLVWIKYGTPCTSKPNPLGKRRTGTLVWILTREGWWNYELWEDEKSEKEVAVADRGMWDHPVAGRVPVATFRSKPVDAVGGGKYSPSWIGGPSKVFRRLYNVLSHKATTQDSSCVPYFTIPVKSPDDLKKMKIGESTAIPFDSQARHRPEFTRYDTGPAEHMATEAERLIRLLKEVVSLAFDDDQAGTGIAKSYAFLQLNVTLASMVPALEAFELELADLVARWEGRDGLPDGAKVVMSRKFDLTDAKADIEQGTLLLQMELGPIARREVKKKALLGRYLQDIPSKDRKDVQKELDEEATEEGADEQLPPPEEDNPPPTPPPVPGQQEPKLRPQDIEPR